MRVSIPQLKKILPKLNLSAEELAERFSMIGHEGEVLDNDTLELKIFSNRQDCRELNFLAKDFAAIYPEYISDNLPATEVGEEIAVTVEQINKILGSNIGYEDFRQLERLGFVIDSNAVKVPSNRRDVKEAADVAEEVFRLVGASNINITMLDRQEPKESPEFEFLNKIRLALLSVGATETRTISFSREGTLELKNPFSAELPYLQPNLTDGLMETLAKNPFSRRNIIFEIADTYSPEEKTHLAIVISGYKKPDDIISQLSKVLGGELDFQPIADETLQTFSVKQPNVLIAETNIDNLKPQAVEKGVLKLPKYRSISAFPPLVRDVTLSQQLNVDDLYQEFPELHLVELIDSYSDRQTGKVTETYRLIFQSANNSFTAEQISLIDEKLDRRFFGKD